MTDKKRRDTILPCPLKQASDEIYVWEKYTKD